MAKKTSRTSIVVVACALIAFAVVSLVGFLFIPLSPAFWIGWGFTGVSYAVCAFALLKAGRDTPDGSFLRAPSCMVACVYAVVQSVAGLVLALLNAPVAIALVVCVLLLAAAVAGMAVLGAGRSYIGARDQEIKTKRAFTDGLLLKVQAVEQEIPAENTEALKAVQALRDDIRYSDPMSCDGTLAIETELEALVAQMAEKAAEDPGAVVALCKKAQALVKRRNLVCKSSK